LVLAQQLDVGAGGSISATATQPFRDVTASGGYVFIRGGTLSLGSSRVTALGGTATGAGINNGTTVTAGDGYVVVQGMNVTGTTSPAAHQL
jgi:predicted S18 family serine protease